MLTLSVLTFTCSDSDGVSINQDLVGNWTGFVGDDENPDDNEYIDIHSIVTQPAILLSRSTLLQLDLPVSLIIYHGTLLLQG
mgnify:CR=1 FL=1